MLKNIDLTILKSNLNENGYAVLPKLFSDEICDKLAATYNDELESFYWSRITHECNRKV